MKIQQLKTVFLLISSFYLIQHGFGQGCSDAGACSIGSMDDFGQHEEAQEEKSLRQIPKVLLSAEQTVGLGEKFTFISQTSIIAEYRFLKNSTLIVRMPFIFATGNLGNATGVGDVLVSLVQQLYQKETSQFGLLLGGKIRSNNANLTFAGNPLPMAYQTSLGTYDIIIGAQYLWKTWDFYLAYQHPFGRNQNEYLNPPGEDDENMLYFESASLKRGDDLALRVQKTFRLKNDQTILAGTMPVYRLQKSEIIKSDRNVVLDQSDGLTLNLYLTYAKKLKQNAMLYITGAFPVIDRDYRADGLTRNFVLTLRVTQFW